MTAAGAGGGSQLRGRKIPHLSLCCSHCLALVALFGTFPLLTWNERSFDLSKRVKPAIISRIALDILYSLSQFAKA